MQSVHATARLSSLADAPFDDVPDVLTSAQLQAQHFHMDMRDMRTDDEMLVDSFLSFQSFGPTPEPPVPPLPQHADLLPDAELLPPSPPSPPFSPPEPTADAEDAPPRSLPHSALAATQDHAFLAALVLGAALSVACINGRFAHIGDARMWVSTGFTCSLAAVACLAATRLSSERIVLLWNAAAVVPSLFFGIGLMMMSNEGLAAAMAKIHHEDQAAPLIRFTFFALAWLHCQVQQPTTWRNQVFAFTIANHLLWSAAASYLRLGDVAPLTQLAFANRVVPASIGFLLGTCTFGRLWPPSGVQCSSAAPPKPIEPPPSPESAPRVLSARAAVQDPTFVAAFVLGATLCVATSAVRFSGIGDSAGTGATLVFSLGFIAIATGFAANASKLSSELMLNLWTYLWCTAAPICFAVGQMMLSSESLTAAMAMMEREDYAAPLIRLSYFFVAVGHCQFPRPMAWKNQMLALSVGNTLLWAAVASYLRLGDVVPLTRLAFRNRAVPQLTGFAIGVCLLSSKASGKAAPEHLLRSGGAEV